MTGLTREQRLQNLVAEHGPAADDRLLLMAALQLADDLFDRTSERDDAVRRAEAAERAPPARPARKSAGAQPGG